MTLPDDIGVPTDAWQDLPLDEALARAARLTGLVEVFSDERHTLLSAANRRAVAASGLRLTVHGPFAELEPASRNERTRRRAVETHRRHLEAAAELGASRYVVHPDYCQRPRPRDAKTLEALQRTFADLEELQEATGVRIVVENMPGEGRSHFVAPGDVDLGRLGLILDTGHAAITGTLPGFLYGPQAELAHVHLHDNRGPADAHDPHLPLGRGVVDAAAVLAVARRAGASVILEFATERDVLESIDHLRRRRLLPEV